MKFSFMLAAWMALWANPARADISDSGNLSIGAQATVASSVTASAFFGDGSHLTGVATSGESNTAHSSFTALGGMAIMGLNAQGQNFSVGGSTFVAAGGMIGVETSAMDARVPMSFAVPDNVPLSLYGGGIVFGKDFTTDDTEQYGMPILGRRKHLGDLPMGLLAFDDNGADSTLQIGGGEDYGYGGTTRIVFEVSASTFSGNNQIMNMFPDSVQIESVITSSTQVLVDNGSNYGAVQIGGCYGCTGSGLVIKNGDVGNYDTTFYAWRGAYHFVTNGYASSPGQEFFTILESGNVGVGNTSPGNALTVGSSPVTWYYCTGSTGGTFDGNLARGNSNAAACAGGTWVATKISSQ